MERQIQTTTKAFGRHFYDVTITSDETYFTVYRDGKPAGTLRRPSRDVPNWTVWNANGGLVSDQAVGPRTGLNALASFMGDR